MIVMIAHAFELVVFHRLPLGVKGWATRSTELLFINKHSQMFIVFRYLFNRFLLKNDKFLLQ